MRAPVVFKVSANYAVHPMLVQTKSQLQNDDNIEERRREAERLALEIGRLAHSALKHRFDFLAHVLDMALVEAWAEAGASDDAVSASAAPPPAGAQR